MIVSYKALDKGGKKRDGRIDAFNKDLAIAALQRRGLIVVSIVGEDDKGGIFQMAIFDKVPQKDVVVFSRQIATLFEAEVSALKAFSMLAESVENHMLKKTLHQVVDDLQAGATISAALGKHNEVFSDFYVSMVRAGEESGKLNDSFLYLADYLDRQYALTSKTRNALIYPAFVVATFIIVMVLMFTMVIPKLSELIIESGQDIPLYTKAIIAISAFIVKYGIFLLIIFVAFVVFLYLQSRTEKGKHYLDGIKISVPLFGSLYQKLYLSRIADNLNTMLSSGISIVRALEITADVVGNEVYKKILLQSVEDVKAGSALSLSFGKHTDMPAIMVTMVAVGEETGGVGKILKTLASFYHREVDEAVDTLVGLIEPVMIVFLGLGVGILLASVLVPIYNIAGGIS